MKVTNEKKQFYTRLEPDLYDQKEKTGLNPFRRFFHNHRQKMINRAVLDIYRPGMSIYDLGCGTVNWNLRKLPVTGVDFNKEMLEYAKRKRRISNYIVTDINELKLKESSADIMIMMDILEHIKDYEGLIKNIWSFLKPGGWLLLNLPYDTWDSLWKPLFKFVCFIEGNILGNTYYQNKCGHVNSFSPKSIRKLMEKYHFQVKSQRANLRLNFLTIARKRTDESSYSKKEWDTFWKNKGVIHKIVDFGRIGYNRFFGKILEDKVNENTRLIELGCGTSTSILTLHNKVQELIGVDFSEEALRISELNANRLKIRNIHFIQDDISNSRLNSNEYDVVWSQGLIEHFENIEKALSEHLRICKNGGWIIISIPSKYSYFYVWYFLSKLPFMKWLWPWSEQNFFTKSVIQKNLRKIKKIEKTRIYYPWLNLLGIIIVEIKKE